VGVISATGGLRGAGTFFALAGRPLFDEAAADLVESVVAGVAPPGG